VVLNGAKDVLIAHKQFPAVIVYRQLIGVIAHKQFLTVIAQNNNGHYQQQHQKDLLQAHLQWDKY
jgi:hypothetical protein